MRIKKDDNYDLRELTYFFRFMSFRMCTWRLSFFLFPLELGKRAYFYRRLIYQLSFCG